MSKIEARQMRYLMFIIIIVGYLAGFIMAIVFNTWWAVLFAPFMVLAVPEPYNYFRDYED